MPKNKYTLCKICHRVRLKKTSMLRPARCTDCNARLIRLAYLKNVSHKRQSLTLIKTKSIKYRILKIDSTCVWCELHPSNVVIALGKTRKLITANELAGTFIELLGIGICGYCYAMNIDTNRDPRFAAQKPFIRLPKRFINPDYSTLTALNGLTFSGVNLFLDTKYPVLPVELRDPRRVPTTYTASLLYARDPICVYCQDSPSDTLDHVLPWSRGGRTDTQNLVGACRTCNDKKGNFLPNEINMKLHLPKNLVTCK